MAVPRVAGPLAGWLGDKWGVEIVVPLILLIGLPFPAILVFKGSLPGFVIVVAIISKSYFACR